MNLFGGFRKIMDIQSTVAYSNPLINVSNIIIKYQTMEAMELFGAHLPWANKAWVVSNELEQTPEHQSSGSSPVTPRRVYLIRTLPFKGWSKDKRVLQPRGPSDNQCNHSEGEESPESGCRAGGKAARLFLQPGSSERIWFLLVSLCSLLSPVLSMSWKAVGLRSQWLNYWFWWVRVEYENGQKRLFHVSALWRVVVGS